MVSVSYPLPFCLWASSASFLAVERSASNLAQSSRLTPTGSRGSGGYPASRVPNMPDFVLTASARKRNVWAGRWVPAGLRGLWLNLTK